jgi:DNA polymerase I-like protein with 3'-5' exonuclease and polymerase domains
MMEAYHSGDPYLSFAKQAGIVPSNATKATHPIERDLSKACSLGVLYGMGARSLALRIGRPEIEARELLRKHHETYRVFWLWSEAAKDYANLNGKIGTVFGWEIHVGAESNPRSLLNFPMQANGAEMLRLACCLATERGVRVCAPIHDALLIEAPLEGLDEAVLVAEEAMAEASRVVLGGFELRTDKKIIRYPDRYKDRRGEKMWNTVLRILEDLG